MDLIKTYDEVLDIIQKSTGNSYEKNNGIYTVYLHEIEKKESYSFVVGLKSDGTTTLFLIYKTNRKGGWWWFCPTEEQATIMPEKLRYHYHRIDKNNVQAKLLFNHRDELLKELDKKRSDN